jgi:hypothetical protein
MAVTSLRGNENDRKASFKKNKIDLLEFFSRSSMRKKICIFVISKIPPSRYYYQYLIINLRLINKST